MEMSKTIEEFETVSQISTVKVSWVAGGITLRRSENGGVRAVQKAARELPQQLRMEVTQTGGRLVITDEKKSWINRRRTRSERTFLELYLPERLLDQLSIASVSNWIVGNEVCVRRLELSTVSGNVRLEGRMDDVTASFVSGEVDLTFHTAPNYIRLSGVSGNGRLRLPREAGFTLDGNSMLGGVNCSYPLMNGKYGDGACRISVAGMRTQVSIEEYFSTGTKRI